MHDTEYSPRFVGMMDKVGADIEDMMDRVYADIPEVCVDNLDDVVDSFSDDDAYWYPHSYS